MKISAPKRPRQSQSQGQDENARAVKIKAGTGAGAGGSLSVPKPQSTPVPAAAAAAAATSYTNTNTSTTTTTTTTANTNANTTNTSAAAAAAAARSPAFKSPALKVSKDREVVTPSPKKNNGVVAGKKPDFTGAAAITPLSLRDDRNGFARVTPVTSQFVQEYERYVWIVVSGRLVLVLTAPEGFLRWASRASTRPTPSSSPTWPDCTSCVKP